MGSNNDHYETHKLQYKCSCLKCQRKARREMSILIRRNTTYNDLSKYLLLDKQQGSSSLSRLEFRQRTSQMINQMMSATTNNIPFLHSPQQSPSRHMFRTAMFHFAGSEHFYFVFHAVLHALLSPLQTTLGLSTGWFAQKYDSKLSSSALLNHLYLPQYYLPLCLQQKLNTY